MRTLDLSEKTIKRAEQAAKLAYDHLCKHCLETGLSPAWELSILSPEETKRRIKSACWWITFDAGGDSWAVDASLNNEPTEANNGIYSTHGPWGYCETYHGIDLMFIDDPSGE